MNLPQLAKVRSRSDDHFVGWFYTETWQASFHLIWPVTQQQTKTYVKQLHGFDLKGEGSFNGKTIEIIKNGATGCYIIALRRWYFTPRWISVLTHELQHATTWLLRDRGMVLNGDSEEAYAYLLESTMRQSLEILNGPLKPWEWGKK